MSKPHDQSESRDRLSRAAEIVERANLDPRALLRKLVLGAAIAERSRLAHGAIAPDKPKNDE